MESDRYAHSSAVAGHFLYVVGGYSSSIESDSMGDSFGYIQKNKSLSGVEMLPILDQDPSARWVSIEFPAML